MWAPLGNYDMRQSSKQEVKVVGPRGHRSGGTQMGSNNSEDTKFAVCICMLENRSLEVKFRTWGAWNIVSTSS